MKKLSKRIFSLLLCLALIASCLPATLLTASAEPNIAALEATRVTDPSTIDQWKQYFGTQTNHPNGVTLSTEFAGGVWTDKSVFTPDNIPQELTRAQYKGKSFPMTDKGDNFLVALSGLASNKQIKGYSTIPTDTVLILDLSSSMRTVNNGSSAVDELVEATNKAITELMALNENNRVSVVVYAGTDNASWSARNGKTRVILPLDTYTTTRTGTYLEAYNNNLALRVVNGVRNSAGQTAHNGASFETSTGTFAQDGLFMGMQELLSAEPVVGEGFQAGTNRIPIMVLMSDGEPTLGHEVYHGTYTTDGSGKKTFTDLGNSNLYSYSGSTADRNGVSHRDTIAFLSSLTAAFAKNRITDHYGEQGLLYTLAYGSTVTTRSEAMSFLNPKDSSSIQNNLWNQFLNDETVTVYRDTSGRQTNYLTTKNSTDPDLRLTAADRYYVDEYFAATNDEAMRSAFDAIVDEIELQSRYYPTYVESDHNHDGYLTFVDKIGSYMEVSVVKGLVIGDRLFSGEALASSLTTVNSNVGMTNDQANRFLQSVCTRLGIANTTVAQTLVNNAYRHGQLAYNATAGTFSNYIGWFSDDSGKFSDFWHEGLASEDYPAEATYIMRSYGFLGDTADIPGVPTTDMMFMTVRIATRIADGDSTITWKIPASLVPTVTYDVEVILDSNGNLTGLQSLGLADDSATDPIRLLYEVELRRDINEWNLLEKTKGATTFYTNKFDANDPFSTELNTYSHFEPSAANERYYYTSDHLVYSDMNGTVYTGGKPSGGTFYHRFVVYEKLGSQLRIHYHYEPITEISLALAESAGNNQWQIPKGTVHRYEDDVTSRKTENTTGTMAYSDHPEVIAENGHYYTYSTQGNNGKLTVTPTTGIKLTKTLAEAVNGASDRFTFTVSGNIANAQVVRLDAQGEEASRAALPANGQVTLTAGETVYIIGLAAGAYTVTENAHADYVVSTVKVDGIAQNGKDAQLTLTAQTIHNVEFTNAPKGYGSLIIAKDVLYPENFAPADAHNSKTFTVNVTFNGDITGMVAPAGAVQNGNTYTVTLTDNNACTFANIPDGTTYTVTETDLPAGYTLSEIRYSDDSKVIGTDDADQVHVVNAYAPAFTTAKLKVQGTKTVTGGWPDGAEFTVRLWQVYDFASGEIVKTDRTATVTKGNAGYTIDISDIKFDKAGTYYIRVAEDIPTGADRIPDMAYDRTLGLFSVTVTDEDADGLLEIRDSAVVGYLGTPVTGNAADGWIVTKDFTNVVTKDLVYLDVEKTLTGFTGNQPPIADIPFGLFSSMDAAEPAFFALTDGTGKTTLMVPVTADGLGTEGKVYYLREIAPEIPDRVVGMSYDVRWLYAIRITWDSVNHKAVTEYAPIENGQVGTYAPYIRQDVTFTHTNVFTPGVESTPAIELSGTKTMTGDTTELNGRVFSFSIYNADATFNPQGQALQTVNNSGSTVAFKPITFDTPGVKHLVVKENTTDLGGVTADSTEYHVTILVEKYNDGDITKLRVADGYPVVVKYGTGNVATDKLDFANKYTVTGETDITISGTKTMTGRPLLLGGFKFRLTEVADANGTALAGGTVLETENGHANSSNAAQFHFPAITYTEEGTHFYRIEEVNTGAAGVTYSTAKYIVRVDVTDNGQGKLTAKQTIVSGGDSIAFSNSYKPMPITTSLRSLKELNGMVLTAGQFSFTITQTGSDFATPVSGGLNETVTNDASGLIQFPDITFAGEDTRYYVIREVNGGQTINGITYDATEYLVTVTATDNHQGSLVLVTDIRAKYMEEGPDGLREVITPVSSILFSNTYAAAPAVFTPQAVKRYERPNGEAMQAFTFTLTGEGENQTKRNSITDGKVIFDQLTFTEAKTYTYTISEQIPSQQSPIKYDTNVYSLTIVVKDNNKGQLVIDSITTASVKGADDLVFLNAHEDLILKKDVVMESAPTVSIDGKVVEVGDVLTYVITYTNYNNQTVDATVTDTIPQYTSYVTGSANEGGVFEGGKITWNLEDVAAEETVTLTFRVTVTGAAGQSVSNQAAVLDAGNSYSSNEVTNPIKEDTVTKDVVAPDAPTVSIGGKTVNPGQVLQYQITYTNTDDFGATVTVTDTIPAHTTYVDGSADNGGVFEGGKVTWTFQLAAGESKTVTFRVKVVDAGITVVNKATAMEGENTVESNQVRNPVTDDELTKDVAKPTAPTVSIDGQTVEKGEELLYTITYTNTDSLPATVTITDTIPQHTSYVDGSADNGGVFASGVITWTLNLAAGESKTVTFRVKVKDYEATVTNQATAYDGINRLESDQVTVTTPPEPQTPDTGDTMNPALLIVLMCLSLTGMAVTVILRRRSLA